MSKFASWLWTNGWQLLAKTTAQIAKAAPGPRAKIAVLNAAGTSAGVAAWVLQRGRRAKTRTLLRWAQARNPVRASILDCFVQAGRDFVWDIVSFSSPALVAGLIEISNWTLMKQALEEKKGAVMIGAHYGPSFNIQTFTHAGSGLNATVLLTEEAAESKKNKTAKAVKFLRTKPDATDPGPERLALAGRQERVLVEKIRAGGSVYVNNDMPREDGGLPAEIIGRQVFLSAFAFKLAIKYQAPVYFCSTKPDGHGSYIWSAEEATDFSSPDEGIRAYTEWLNALIMENPTPWHGLRFFKEPKE